MKAPLVYGLIASAGLALAAAACSSNAAPAATPAPASVPAKPTGTLAQVMRGIYFPNANLLFDVQQRDPGAPPKPAGDGRKGSTTEQFSSIYSGWQVQENAAIALAEAVDLLTIPGRVCQNGKAVPMDREDYKKAAHGMREAALVALEAARAKNLEKAIAATDTVAEACATCHEVYRDKGEADGPERCTPPAVKTN
jgi:hypothetical protein